MALSPRGKMDQILKEWGHNVILQRRVDDEFVNTLERHTVRHMYPANRGLPQVAEEEPEGIVHNADMIYYFRYDANPAEGDRIYEEDPNGKTTWLIDYSLPMRGRGGQIVYWVAGVTRENPN